MHDNSGKVRNRNKPHIIMVGGDSRKIMQQILGSLNSGELITSLAIEIWRLEKYLEKMRVMLMKESDGRSNTVFDQMQRIKDIYKKHDIEVRDHTGEKYSEGMSLKLLHVEESKDITGGEMVIIETIQPSVYFEGKVVSRGEVIVRKGK